jgi:hypothetical protein
LEQQSPTETSNAVQDDAFSNLPNQRIAFGQVFRDNTTALIRKSTGQSDHERAWDGESHAKRNPGRAAGSNWVEKCLGCSTRERDSEELGWNRAGRTSKENVASPGAPEGRLGRFC